MIPNPKFMRLALDLARRALGQTAPNPVVGAVLTKDGHIIGRGYHHRAGTPHAEVQAINDCGQRGGDPRGAILYVSLEPCCHFGRTPPCTDLLIQVGIERVFAAVADPNPRVAGKGAERLRGHGIPCEVGLLEMEARRLNGFFFNVHLANRPWFILKGGTTLDGKIAPGDRQSRWITCPESRQRVQRLRRECDAILIGAGTVRADNPRLIPRIRHGPKNPARVVLCGSLNLPWEGDIFADTDRYPTLVYTLSEALDQNRVTPPPGVEIVGLPRGESGSLDLFALSRDLVRRDLLRVLIEGGSATNAAFLRAGLVDEIRLFLAPLVFGGQGGANNPLAFIGGQGAGTMRDGVPFIAGSCRRSGEDFELSFFQDNGRKDV